MSQAFTDEPIVSLLKKYKDVEGVVAMEEVNGEELVKRFAEEMEEMLGRKMKSVKVIMIKTCKGRAAQQTCTSLNLFKPTHSLVSIIWDSIIRHT